jgi:hypothetical protein
MDCAIFALRRPSDRLVACASLLALADNALAARAGGADV